MLQHSCSEYQEILTVRKDLGSFLSSIREIKRQTIHGEGTQTGRLVSRKTCKVAQQFFGAREVETSEEKPLWPWSKNEYLKHMNSKKTCDTNGTQIVQRTGKEAEVSYCRVQEDNREDHRPIRLILYHDVDVLEIRPRVKRESARQPKIRDPYERRDT